MAVGGGNPSPADTKAPVLTKVRVLRKLTRAKGGSVAFTLSEAANVRVVVERRRGRKWVRLVALTKFRIAGNRSIALPKGRLKSGQVRIRLIATDAAKNHSKTRTLTAKVRARLSA